MAAKKPPTNVLRLLAEATARIAKQPKKKPTVIIPPSTLSSRIKRRKQK